MGQEFFAQIGCSLEPKNLVGIVDCGAKPVAEKFPDVLFDVLIDRRLRERPFLFARLPSQFVLKLDNASDLDMGSFDGGQEQFFRNLVRFALDHHDRVTRASDHHVQFAVGDLR